MFAKLDISSRRELRHALRQDPALAAEGAGPGA